MKAYYNQENLLFHILFSKPLLSILFLNFVSNILIIMSIFLLTICFAKTNLLFFSFLFALADKVFLFGFVALKANTILMLILSILLNKVFLFALIFFLISIITLFFLLIDGSLILKYYLIFKAFGCFYCIRAKSFFTFSFFDKKGLLVTKHLRDIKPILSVQKFFLMFFLLENCLKLILLFLLILIILILIFDILLLMMTLIVLLKIILIVLVLLNAFLNPKNQMVLD